MVSKKLFVLVCLLIAACSFEERSFKSDLACESDQDCARPDQECRANLCTQRTCSATATCPIGHEFSCASGLCVVAECTSGASCAAGYACNEGYCQASFNVATVLAVSNTSIAITFDSPPDATTASDADNYSVAGLTLSAATLSGSTVTLTTTSQTTSSYTVSVSNVLRAFDKSPLITATGTFTGRGAFSLVSATSTSAITVALTFSEPPNPTAAVNPANYAINNGLTLQNSPAPTLAGNVVTLTTGSQTGATYTVTVSNVARANDSELLATSTAMFTGRTDFNIASIEVKSSTQIAVTFDAPPNAAQAVTLANYTVDGLTLSGTPALAGTVVTLTTSVQADQTYTLVIAGVTRSSDGEALTVDTSDFAGRPPFNVSDALARSTRSISITFDGPPDVMQATTLANYAVGGLILSGTPILAGNVVFIDTSTQTGATYTATVSNVRRDGDAEALTNNSAMFAGRAPFNVTTASATSSTSISVTFSNAPNSGEAILAGNYAITGGVTVLDASAPTGNTVTLTTTPMTASAYTVTVAGVSRASDGEALSTATANFTGRSPFNVASAAAPTSSTITVTFDAPPNALAAMTLANYSVPGLTLSGTPVLSTSTTVTLTTSVQLAETYTVTVSNVSRAADGEALTLNTAAFTGRTRFNVSSASSGSNVTLRVTFDAAPNPTEATMLGNYDVPGLTLSGIALSGNTVTITTSNQTGAASYTVTVTDVTRLDGEPLLINSATFTGLSGFNVAGAVSVNTTTVTVTFDAVPVASAAQSASNYTVTGNGGLSVSSASLSGNTVTLTTSAQISGTYTVTVGSAVTRLSDGSPLVVNSAPFSYVSFNVAGAAGLTNRSASVTFDAPPNATQAGLQGNYTVACSPNPCTNITLSAPVLSGNTVTLTTTSQQAGKNYTITVNNVTRDSDGSALTIKTGTFAGRTAFNVTSAAAPTSGTMTVTFDGAPDPVLATNLANYSVPNLTLSGTPTLSGNVVTINTSVQTATTYTVTVANVVRTSDREPLSTNTANFTGKAQSNPTVTNVVVQSTVPDNGTTFFNTGSATVVITGTEFNGVICPTGVKLDDVDGAGVLVNTKPTSCTVNSATSITATFPAGIRSNYGGWNVQVTNSVNTNATSTVKLVVKAGLLVSEVYAGSSGGGNDTKEYLELYNPTANTINLDSVGIVIHVRNGSGGDTTLSTNTTGGTCGGGGTCTKDIPSGKFWLLVSTVSTGDSWYANRNAVYSASTTSQLTPNGAVYLSLSSTPQSRVIDKAGWGNQAAVVGREGTAISNFGNDNKSTQREPGNTAATTDTDNNSADFTNPSTTINPEGTRN